MRGIRIALPVVGAVLGFAVVQALPSWVGPWVVVGDIAVGTAFFTLGAVALRQHRPVAILALATGLAWYAGTLFSLAHFWHRGPLVHLLLALPLLRPRSRIAVAGIAVGYVAAVVPPVWGTDTVAVALSVGIVAIAAALSGRARGRERRTRAAALVAASVLCIAIAGGVIVRAVTPRGEGVIPALVAFDFALVVIATILAVGLRQSDPALVADLVIDLEEERSETLREALARAIGDQTLEVGYWDADTASYRDAENDPLALPDSGARTATRIDRDGAPFMVLVHETTLLDDPELLAAVTSAGLVTAANADLRAQTRAQVGEVAASRRRLVVAADEERRRLSAELDAAVRKPLADLVERIGARRGDDGRDEGLVLARERLIETQEVLDATLTGLRPRELADGLVPALHALAARSALPVETFGTLPRLDSEIEAAVYYACAEAVANAAKHSRAASVSIRVSSDGIGLVAMIVDDGVGGADASRGTGIEGIRDRIAALGGSVDVDSPIGGGTRVRIGF